MNHRLEVRDQKTKREVNNVEFMRICFLVPINTLSMIVSVGDDASCDAFADECHAALDM